MDRVRRRGVRGVDEDLIPEDQASPAEGEKSMNSRIQRASSPAVGGQRNPRSSSSGWCRPWGSSGSSRRMETSLSLQGVIGWPLVGGWNRQLIPPGPWGRASARLGLGHVRRRCRLNPGGGVLARRGDTGLCGLLRRPSFAWPGTKTGNSGDFVWSCRFQPLAEG